MKTFAYEIDAPEGYENFKTRSCPMILFLHGSGEGGGDRYNQVRKHGPWMTLIPEDKIVDKKVWANRNRQAKSEIKKFFIVAPHQRTKGEFWDINGLNKIITDVKVFLDINFPPTSFE